MTWRTLDLLCGAAGGWSLGLHRAGFATDGAPVLPPNIRGPRYYH